MNQIANVGGTWVRDCNGVRFALTLDEAATVAASLLADGERVEIRETDCPVRTRFGARYVYAVRTDGARHFYRKLPIKCSAGKVPS